MISFLYIITIFTFGQQWHFWFCPGCGGWVVECTCRPKPQGLRSGVLAVFRDKDSLCNCQFPAQYHSMIEALWFSLRGFSFSCDIARLGSSGCFGLLAVSCSVGVGASFLDWFWQDKKMRNALHHCIQPKPHLSYESCYRCRMVQTRETITDTPRHPECPLGSRWVYRHNSATGQDLLARLQCHRTNMSTIIVRWFMSDAYFPALRNAPGCLLQCYALLRRERSLAQRDWRRDETMRRYLRITCRITNRLA